jgi:nucleotide-binding universal stress UspA family protein
MSGPVLICYDGSESGAAAIRAAGALLRPKRALVLHTWIGLSRLLLHADVREGPIGEAAADIDQADDRMARELAGKGVALARESGFDAQPLAAEEHEKTWRSILAAADEHDAALVVIGARGHGRVKEALLGSVSTAVANHARRPVLVVHGTGAPAAGPLLLAYDGSEDAAHAIRTGAELLAERRGVVVHTWRSWQRSAPGLAGVSAGVGALSHELDEAVARQSEATCGAGVEIARAAGLEAEGNSRRSEGPEWRALLDAAEEVDATAIVVGSRGLTGVSAVLGSVSHGIVHHARRPLLLVPLAPRE